MAGDRRRQNAAGSIALRLVLFAVALATLTAAGVGLLSYTRARRALEAETGARLRVLARDAADALHRELAERVVDVTSWARLETMRAIRFHDVDKELAEVLRRLLEGRDVYRGVACLDGAGTVVASAGAVGELRWSGRPSRPRVLVPGDAGADGAPFLQLEAPVADPDQPGTPIGTLVALLDPAGLLRAAATLVRAQGTHGALAVRTADGVTVLDTAREPAAPSRDGRLRGTATAPPLATAEAPRFDVTVSEPAAVALAAVDALRAALVRMAAVAILVASLLGAVVALWIGRPIHRLTRAVQRVSDTGELELADDVPSSGEVGVLAAAFARTLATVREQQAELLGQSRLATLGEVAASVAHEVRTPLSVLKTSAQLLDRPGLAPDDRQQLAALVSAEVDRLNRVVTDLVDLARPRPAVRRPESLHAVLARATRLFAATAERRGIRIQTDSADDRLTVQASRDQLHQVFVNLLHNALQATPDGGRITVSAHVADGGTAVTVQDTGPGFADAVLPQLFTRFRTTKPDGTGLGLVIARRLVEEHGGRIDAGNVPGGGARVTVWLPRGEAA